jgi:hypothetical protein
VATLNVIVVIVNRFLFLTSIVLCKTASPCFTNESSPCFTNESSPCFTNESSPCFTNESSPGFTSPVQSRFYNMPCISPDKSLIGTVFNQSETSKLTKMVSLGCVFSLEIEPVYLIILTAQHFLLGFGR